MGHLRYSGRYNLAVRHRFSHASLRADRGAIPDGQVPGDPRLPCQYGVSADSDAAGDAHLGYQDGVFADDDVMRNMHQIVRFNPPADKGFAERRPVDGVIGTDFNIVLI